MVMTKKNIVIGSLLFGLIALVSGYLSDNHMCSLGYRQCESIAYSLVLFVPLFSLAVIFYFGKDELFIRWAKFVKWWAPIGVLMMILAPRTSDYLPFNKKIVFLFATGILVLISIILALYKGDKSDE